MAIIEHPKQGSILTCDFTHGFKNPEMAKPSRPVIILTPKIKSRYHLCTIVALSTTTPEKVMPYHAQLDISPPLPRPFGSTGIWVKGDMVNAVGFHRLNFICRGKDLTGRRQYYYHTLSEAQMKVVRKCVLHGMGLSKLTKHL